MTTSTLLDLDTTHLQSTEPRPVQLPTRHDYSLTTRALEREVATITKLAKAAALTGYAREARLMAADAAAIREYILPEFGEQRELPLATTEQVRARIGEALRDVARRAFVGLIAKTSETGEREDDEQHEERQRSALRYRENDLLEQLAVRIEAFAAEIAERAYAAGYAARATDPEAIALKCVRSLSGAGI